MSKTIKEVKLISEYHGGMWKGKCYQITDTAGNIAIQSFYNIVAMKINNVWYRTWNNYSRSTMSHINKIQDKQLNSKKFYELPYKRAYKYFENAIINY